MIETTDKELNSMQPTHTLHRGRLLAVLLTAPFMAQADVAVANVGTSSIHADLGASGAALQLIIGGYVIAFAVLLITGARLGQTHGYRRVFLVGVATFTAASLLCGLAPSPPVLVVARVIQGAGAALMFPQTLTGIQLNFTGTERTRAIALYSVALSSGAVVGQLLSGVLISANLAGSQWRAIFLINVPIGAALIGAAWRYLPIDEQRVSRRVDLVGVAVLSASLLLVILPLILGHAEGWPVWIWIALAASVPVSATFIVTERRLAARGGAALVNLDILAQRPVGWGLLTLLVSTGTYYALLFTLAQYLQQGLGRGALASGLTLVPWVAAFGFAGQVVRRVPARLESSAAPAGCAILAVAYLAISVSLFADQRGQALLIVLLGFGGFGLGIQFSALIAHLTNSVPDRYAPDITGVTTTISQIGGAIGVAALGTLYFSLASQSGPVHATHAFALVTAGLAAGALLASAMAFRSTHA